MTRISMTTIAASLAFSFVATAAFAHAQLEKATPAVGGTVASASEVRLEFSEGVEPEFSKVELPAPAAPPSPGSCDNRGRQPGRAHRADRETPLRRRVQSALAGGVGRHPPHAGNL